MPEPLLRPILGILGLTQIQHVPSVRRGAATGLVAQVYRQVEADFGVLAPPIALHACAPRSMAAAWVLLRETLIVPGVMSRVDKEAVAAAVSRHNACPYCVKIHDNVAGRLGAGAPADLPSGDHPELLGMALVMHYLNRMVNVFLRDVPLPPGVPRWALRPVMRVLGGDLLNATRGTHLPGASLHLLPATDPLADLPDDLRWATGATHLPPALARVAAEVADGASRAVPGEVQDLVLGELSEWDGAPRGISRAWVEDLVAGLPPRRRPAGRLALLVAFASYQVDGGVVRRFRESDIRGGPAAVIELSAWSALSAARRMVFLASRTVSKP